MIIDSSYFVGPVTIAQLGQSSVEENLNDYINEYEPEFLRKVLGYELSQSFITGIDVGSDETIEAKWLDILQGKEFTDYNDRKRRWRGFEGNTTVSPIAAYVYWHYVRDQLNKQTGSGTVKVKNENSTVVSPIIKMISVWNEMAERVQVLWRFLELNQDIYTDYRWIDIDRNSLIKQNQFGI